MKHILTETDRDILNKHISEAEEKTNAQIVLAAIRRCDNYAEVPWKAFAIGSSLTALAVFLIDLIIFRWTTDTIILFAISSILIAGTLLSLLTIILPDFARLLIPKIRQETETIQYAEALFLSNELFATDGRRGILLLISRFERQVVILRDKGVIAHLNDENMKKIISEMTPLLKKNEIRNALETGLNLIVEAICPPLPEGKNENELSNEIIEEDGE